MSRILVVDNYDSFVHTIVGYLEHLGATVETHRNDALDRVTAADLTGYDGVLISPGPGTPKKAGRSEDIIEACAKAKVPMLGVCLGHQALAEVYGGVVGHADELMHGQTSKIHHDGAGVFAGLPNPMTATRYHSLAAAADTVPDELEVTARTDSGIVMGLQHRELPLTGVQFHPESVLTDGGYLLLANWLATTGLSEAPIAAASMAPRIRT